MFDCGITRRGFVSLAGLAAAGMSLTACAGSRSSFDPNIIRIGGIGPITGPAAIYGKATQYGAQCAVDLINQAAGKTVFELQWEDDEHDPEKAINAYNTLKDWGMQILVGTTTTAPCVAVSSESNYDKIFELTPSASSTDVIGGQTDEDDNMTIPRKDNVFQMCFTDPNQGTASARYIASQKLGTKVAVIYNNADAYSTGIYRKFDTEAKNVGLEIVSATAFTDDSANDFTVQLNEAKQKGADLVFLPIYYTPASLILTQAHTMGFAPKFFGVDGLDGILTVEGFDAKLAEGVMLLTPFVASANDEETKAFVAAYKKTTGTEESPNQFAADAFDCVNALYAAIQEAEKKGFGGITGATSVEDACKQLIGVFTGDFTFSGLTGKNMKWSASGEVSKDPKGMIIKNGVYEPMDQQ